MNWPDRTTDQPIDPKNSAHEPFAAPVRTIIYRGCSQYVRVQYIRLIYTY